MADLLAAFLQEAEAAPFVLGTWDCMLTPANWVQRVLGRDPVAVYRGTYDSELGWRRILKQGGGAVRVFGDCMEGAGLMRTAEPTAGDVAIVETPLGELGAIYVGHKRFAVKTLDGMLTGVLPPAAIWALPT